jgi:hypothetical protein
LGPPFSHDGIPKKYELKDKLINHLVGMLGDSFNKQAITLKVGTYLKYVRDQYRSRLVKKPKYDHPVAIPEREWKNILEDAKDIALRYEGKTLPSLGR